MCEKSVVHILLSSRITKLFFFRGGGNKAPKTTIHFSKLRDVNCMFFLNLNPANAIRLSLVGADMGIRYRFLLSSFRC